MVANDPVAPNSDRRDALRIAYEEVCKAHDGIADFRAKLLALLPIASGTGIFLLLDLNCSARDYLPAVGIFGALVTLGLYMYELRGIQKCNILTACGKTLEMEILGNSVGRGAFTDDPPAAFGFVGNTWASRIVYSTIVGAWAYVALSCKSGPSPVNLLVPGVVVIAMVALGYLVGSRQERLQQGSRG